MYNGILEIFLYQTGSEVLEFSRQISTTALEDPSLCEGTQLQELHLYHVFKSRFFFPYTSECVSPFLSSPFFHFWQGLKRFLHKGTRCYHSMPSFIPCFIPLPTTEISASSRYIMRGKNSCSITVSHFQHTMTPNKLEDSPVIFYLLVYNSRWEITCALSLPSRIKRSAYSSKWDRDFKQRKSLASPR